MTVKQIFEQLWIGEISHAEAQEKLAKLLNPKLNPLSKSEAKRAKLRYGYLNKMESK